MILWARVRHVRRLAVSLVAMLVLGVVLGPSSLALPSLFGDGTNVVLISTFVPLIWAAAVADSFASRGLSLEARPFPLGRFPLSRLGILDAAAFATTTAVAAVSFGVFVILTGSPFAGIGAVLVLAGITCIGTLCAGPSEGVMSATTIALLTTIYGAQAPAGRYVRVLQPDGDAIWSIVCGLLLCSAACWLMVSDKAVVQLRRIDPDRGNS